MIKKPRPNSGQLPPQAVEIEMAVLGAMMREVDAALQVWTYWRPMISTRKRTARSLWLPKDSSARTSQLICTP